jgi:hypothetical protein
LGARPLRKMVERLLQDAVVRDLFQTGSGCGKVLPDLLACRLMIARAQMTGDGYG